MKGPRFRPGDIVRIRRRPAVIVDYDNLGNGVIVVRKYITAPAEVVEGVIVRECFPFPCRDCIRPECYEWAMVVLLNSGELINHVSECRMELSELGEGMRAISEERRRLYGALPTFDEEQEW